MKMVSTYLRDHEFLLPRSAILLASLDGEFREFLENTCSDQLDALSQFLDVLKTSHVNRQPDRDPVSERC